MIDDRDPSSYDDSRDEGAEDVEEGDEHERRRLFERTVPLVVRRLLERALESGVEKLSEGPENVRHLLADLKLPKEALHYIYSQIDDTKKGLYRVVAKEIRDVLEHTKFSDEIAEVLTKLSFEINTQIRFVPNPQASQSHGNAGEEEGDSREEGSTEGGTQGIPRPKVVSKVVMKARDKLDRRNKP